MPNALLYESHASKKECGNDSCYIMIVIATTNLTNCMIKEGKGSSQKLLEIPAAMMCIMIIILQ